MTNKEMTEFQQISNSKGWTFEEIAKRWGKVRKPDLKDIQGLSAAGYGCCSWFAEQ